VRGFKSLVKSKLITDAWLVHYNFFKEHTTLDDVPPAQNMGIPVPFKDWREVVEGKQKNKPNFEVPTIMEKGEPEKRPRRKIAHVTHKRLYSPQVSPSLAKMK